MDVDSKDPEDRDLGRGPRTRGDSKGNPSGKDGGVPQHYTAGLEFALTILVFVAIGWWLDSKFATSPWLLIGFLFLGFFSALYSLTRRVSQ
jgi:F0F1-type ATP synthase assembly protein I